MFAWFHFHLELRYGLMMCLAPNNQVPLSLYFKILHNYQLLVYLYVQTLFMLFLFYTVVYFLIHLNCFFSTCSFLFMQSDQAASSAMVISLDLRNFILRARVLKLYRQALRITQRAPGDSRAELRHTIRQEMESNRNCSDKQRIRFLISEGLERLKRLDEMLDMQGH